MTLSMPLRRNVLRGVVSTSLIVAILAGCSTNNGLDKTPSSTPTASNADVTWRTAWSASPGVNLFSRGAELVRATMESAELVQQRGADDTFPGYADAIGPRPPRFSSDNDSDTEVFNKNYGYLADWVKPVLQPPAVRYPRIVDLREDNSRVSATVCSYNLLIKAPPNMHKTNKWGLGDGYEIALEKSPAAERGHPGIADERSNLPRFTGKVPSWNVFRSWKITKMHFDFYDKISPLCTQWWKSVFPDAVKESDSYRVIVPGPVPAASNVPQYPRWLGPRDSQ